MEYICELKNIGKNFHTISTETVAVKNVSLKIQEGEIVSIVGPSGCGKSTLLSIIAGYEEPTRGSVFIRSSNIGFMFQKDHLYEWRTILDNCLLGLEIKKKLTKENIERVRDMLKRYGLGQFENHYPRQLSGGMRQRAALARTLAIEPDLLLLDEPFSALDYQTRLAVGNEVGEILRKEKVTAIMVTHDIPEAVSISDRVIVMTKRPSVIKKEFEIKFDSITGDRTPLVCRNAPEFGGYFNTIWEELDLVE